MTSARKKRYRSLICLHRLGAIRSASSSPDHNRNGERQYVKLLGLNLIAFLAVSGFDPAGAARCFEMVLVCLSNLGRGPLPRRLVAAHHSLAELRMTKQKNPAPAAAEWPAIDAIDPADIDTVGMQSP